MRMGVVNTLRPRLYTVRPTRRQENILSRFKHLKNIQDAPLHSGTHREYSPCPGVNHRPPCEDEMALCCQCTAQQTGGTPMNSQTLPKPIGLALVHVTL